MIPLSIFEILLFLGASHDYLWAFIFLGTLAMLAGLAKAVTAPGGFSIKEGSRGIIVAGLAIIAGAIAALYVDHLNTLFATAEAELRSPSYEGKCPTTIPVIARLKAQGLGTMVIRIEATWNGRSLQQKHKFTSRDPWVAEAKFQLPARPRPHYRTVLRVISPDDRADSEQLAVVCTRQADQNERRAVSLPTPAVASPGGARMSARVAAAAGAVVRAEPRYPGGKPVGGLKKDAPAVVTCRAKGPGVTSDTIDWVRIESANDLSGFVAGNLLALDGDPAHLPSCWSARVTDSDGALVRAEPRYPDGKLVGALENAKQFAVRCRTQGPGRTHRITTWLRTESGGGVPDGYVAENLVTLADEMTAVIALPPCS